MTIKELAGKIRTTNPQYSHLTDEALVDYAVKQKPELKTQLSEPVPNVKKQEALNKSKELINEITKNNTPEEQPHPLGSVFNKILDVSNFAANMNIGFAKGVAGGAIDLGKQVISSNPVMGVMGKTKAMNESMDKTTAPIDKKLEASNTAQKIGKGIETAVEIAVPVGAAKKAKNAASIAEKLTMNADELEAFSNSKFKKVFGIEKSELMTEGMNRVKKMPAKVEQLAKEFKGILKSSNPSKNLEVVKKVKREVWNQNLNLIKSHDKSFNLKQIQSYIKKSIKDNMVLGEKETEILDKTLKPFMKNLKSGTLSGLEEARGAMSASGRKASGEIKQAEGILNKAVQQFIREQLPQEKRAVYNSLKGTYARLLNVQDILKAKNAAIKPRNVLKSAVKGAIGAGAVIGAGNYIKSLFK